MTSVEVRSPFSLRAESKRRDVLAALNDLTAFHLDRCVPYRRMLAATGSSVLPASRIEDLPYLPVPVFKMMELRSVRPDGAGRTLASSGTTSSVRSKVFLDA